jgi:imidazolonepropionase-like amidohydrolase
MRATTTRLTLAALLLVIGAACTRNESAPAGAAATEASTTSSASAAPTATPGEPAPPVTLFRDVRVFNGKELSGPSHVLVRGNLIERISTTPIDTPAGEHVTVIDGGGRTLMPGLIDAHAHPTFYNLPMAEAATADASYLQIRQAAGAKNLLLAGFTSVRDVSGPVFGLKRAIDEGLVVGPRIWPSGPMISQTSGHSDFRTLGQLPSSVVREPIPQVRFGYNYVADGVPAVLVGVREQLMQGASQIKLAVGGGVTSNYDPIDVTEYSLEEIKAAVGAAEDWGTYVAVHGYTPRAIRRAIEAGVKCVDHGQMLDEPTIKLIAEKGVWLSLQPFLEDEDAIPTAPGSDNERKYKQVSEGTARAYTLAKKYKVKTAFGTDIQFNPKGAERQAYYLPKLVKWYSPAEALKMATADNAELLALSGPRNPYPGKLGVVEEGALADLLLVDGDPLANIKLLENPQQNLVVIMKDGQVYKNSL